MSGVYKVDVVCPLAYKLVEDFRESPGTYSFAYVTVAYFIVLTIDTSEVTAGKKYGAAAVFTAYGRLLPKVKSCSCENKPIGFTAIALFLLSVCTALSRTDITFHFYHRRYFSIREDFLQVEKNRNF